MNFTSGSTSVDKINLNLTVGFDCVVTSTEVTVLRVNTVPI